MRKVALVGAGMTPFGEHVAPGILADTRGLPDVAVARVENCCATRHDAMRDATVAIAAGGVVDRTDQPVSIRGVGLGVDSATHQHDTDMTTFPSTGRAAGQAVAVAGAISRDVDVAEVHDFVTGIEPISYEDLGFADRLEAHTLVEAEVTALAWALPANTSRGLKVKGHPPGATGVARRVELFGQLRGEAANQIDGARTALAHTPGGPTAVSAATILEGPN